jgi:hypothetical protein
LNLTSSGRGSNGNWCVRLCLKQSQLTIPLRIKWIVYYIKLY